MWRKLDKLLLVACLLLFFSVPCFAQDTSRENIISNQELIISIAQRLTVSLNSREAIIQQESESLQAEKQALAQEKADFEIYKQSTQATEADLLTLKDSLKKQSEQLANLNNLVSWGVPIAVAFIVGEAIIIALKN